MINLTYIIISSQEDIVDFRNKLLILLLELKFREMEGVGIATQVSDLIHRVSFNENPLKISIGFENDHLLRIQDINQKELINFSFPIKNKFLLNDKDFIQKLKEKMITQSKSALVREIKNKNEQLSQLLEDLKKSSSLIQSEKMRALGVLTAGVAHELNNPMMGILNFIQYCLKKTDPEDKRFEPLKDAEHETKRCIEIVSNLLTFSHLEKEGSEKFKPINILTLIDRVIKILSYRMRNEKVTIQKDIPENLPTIMGHENRLQQVILNLVTNALDAMKNSATKCLTLKVQSIDDHLKVMIADTGEGMSEETKIKIFEPFFTTKPAGAGTGLGLAVCDSIVKEHSGNIICHSERNKGTQFSITLPLKSKELL